MTVQHGARRDRRSLWVRFALWVGPLIAPLLLLAVVSFVAISSDAEPAGFGAPSTGLIPGAATVTGWERDTSLVPDGFGRNDPGHASPRALVDAMVSEARQTADAQPWITGELVSEDRHAATARVYLPVPDYPDAWVAAELLLELTREPDGWRVDDAHVRFHCQHTVRGALCA